MTQKIQRMNKNDQDTLCDVLLNARHAFELFEKQNILLSTSFNRLEQNLVDSQDELEEQVGELHRVLSRLQCIIESLRDGVLVFNCKGEVEFFNEATLTMLGKNESTLRTKKYQEIIDSPLQVKRLAHVLESGKADLCREFEIDSPCGGRLILQSTMTPVNSPTEGMLGVVEVLRNVTEIRQLERQVKHAQHMASLGEMAAGVAHELRNPLGSIEGFARLLKNDLERDKLPRYSRLAERIVEGTESLNYVITNLLDYARPVRLEYSMFPVQRLMASLVDCLIGPMKTHRVQLFVQAVEPEVEIFGDLRQLRHVLLNLGRNAIEACPQDGQVNIGFYLYQGEAAFHVSDNGIGIAEEQLEKVFDPFFTTKQGGTGLGLSFCHKIVDAHGGELLVQSNATEGTIFQMILPLWRNI